MLYIQLFAQMCHLCQYMCAPASVLINQISCSACASTPAVQICSISHGPGECERVNSLTDTHTQAPPPQSSVKWGSATVWGLSDNKTHFTAAALYRTGLHRALAKAQQLPRLFNLHLLRPNTPSLFITHTQLKKIHTLRERELKSINALHSNSVDCTRRFPKWSCKLQTTAADHWSPVWWHTPTILKSSSYWPWQGNVVLHFERTIYFTLYFILFWIANTIIVNIKVISWMSVEQNLSFYPRK